MARLQILELPTEHHGDDMVTPFVLVIDEWEVDSLDESAALNAYWDDFGKKIGARGILFVDRAIEIPANNVTAPVDDAFKAEVEQWAAGTNKAIARIIEAFSHPRKRPRRDPVPRPESWTGRPTHPDGTPYGYSEIAKGGWESCDGCRTWGQWTAEHPHDCPGTYIKGPTAQPVVDA